MRFIHRWQWKQVFRCRSCEFAASNTNGEQVFPKVTEVQHTPTTTQPYQLFSLTLSGQPKVSLAVCQIAHRCFEQVHVQRVSRCTETPTRMCVGMIITSWKLDFFLASPIVGLCWQTKDRCCLTLANHAARAWRPHCWTKTPLSLR